MNLLLQLSAVLVLAGLFFWCRQYWSEEEIISRRLQGARQRLKELSDWGSIDPDQCKQFEKTLRFAEEDLLQAQGPFCWHNRLLQKHFLDRAKQDINKVRVILGFLG